MDFEPLTQLRQLRQLRHSLLYALPLVVLAALAVVTINELSYRHSTQTLSSMVERGDARLQVQSLMRGLVDAENGQRGFLLTARAGYLEPYESGVRLINESLAALRRFHADDEAMLEQVNVIDDKVHERLSEMATTLEMQARGRHDLWLELVLSDIGKDKMDELRRAVSALHTSANRRVDTQYQAVDHKLWGARWSVHLMTAVALGALLLFLRKTRDLDRAQEEQARRAPDAANDPPAAGPVRRPTGLTGQTR